ncbi:MAG: hypothetical protein LKI24_07520 [Acidipropionibacterium sp.]|nr:hypothetical protein [Acidipropionibacterium sp.]
MAAQLAGIPVAASEGIIQGFGPAGLALAGQPECRRSGRRHRGAAGGARLGRSALHLVQYHRPGEARNGRPGRAFLTEADSFAAQIKLARVPAQALNGWLDECCRRAASRGVVGIRDMEFSSSYRRVAGPAAGRALPDAGAGGGLPGPARGGDRARSGHRGVRGAGVHGGDGAAEDHRRRVDLDPFGLVPPALSRRVRTRRSRAWTSSPPRNWWR